MWYNKTEQMFWLEWLRMLFTEWLEWPKLWNGAKGEVRQ